MKFILPFNLGKIWIVTSKGQAVRAGTAFKSKLIIRKIQNGIIISEQDLGDGLVTDVGARLLAADYVNVTATLKLANNHDTGTGSNTPSVADTVMQIPTGMSRGVGSQSNTLNTYQTVGNVTFSGSFLVKEWGLFTASVGGTMWDHKTWSGTNVQNGDILQFVYQLTVLSGG